MKPDKQNLIHDLLDNDSGRENILGAGNRILRRRRQWRVARQVIVAFALVAAVSIFYLRRESVHSPFPAVSQKAPLPATAPQVYALTDDELLAMFTNTPVGLVSLSGGKKRLIFPRPGDEQRFITRL
jgi:hypothetical protein